jgi:hypothetical protein
MTRTRIALLILPMLIIVAGPAHAQRYLLTPAITLQGTYDDNVFFVEDNDFEYYLGPSLTLDAQTERSSLNLLAALHIYRYGSYDEFDRVNQSYLLSGSHRMTEQLTFTLGAGYQRDKTFDVALEELALLRVDPVDRNIYSIAPGFAYEINPRTEASLGYRLEIVDYDEDLQHIDNILHVLSLGVSRLITERTSLSLTGVGSIHTYDAPEGDRTHQEAALFAGISYLVTETVTANLNAGIGRVRFEDDADGRSDNETRFLASGELERRLERLTLSGSYQRDITTDPQGDSLTRDRLRARVRYAFSERLNGSFVAMYVHTETNEFLTGRQTRELYRVTPSLVYLLGEQSRLELGWTYSHLDREEDSRDRNRVYLSVTFEFPREY